MARKWRNLYMKGRILMLGERARGKHLSYQPLEKLTDDPQWIRKSIACLPEEKTEWLRGFYDEVYEILCRMTHASPEVRGRWIWLENDLRNMLYLVTTGEDQ